MEDPPVCNEDAVRVFFPIDSVRTCSHYILIWLSFQVRLAVVEVFYAMGEGGTLGE